MRKKLLVILTIFIQNILFSQSTTIQLISWNIRDFGKTKNATTLEQIADIVKDADILALQEVVAGYGGAQAVAKLSDILNRKGAQWDYIISDPTNSPPYMTERYAIIWKTTAIKIKNRGGLIHELATTIDREPLVVDFYTQGKKFTLINFHSRPYGKNPIPEISALTSYIINTLPTPLLIAGDFNTNEAHEVFSAFKKNGFLSSITNQKTTLKKSCATNNSYLNYAIDNIFYSKNIRKTTAGVIDFVKTCEQLTAARKISDHLPVFLEFVF